MLRSVLLAGAATALLSLGACGQSAEKTGENMDSSIENATQGHENLGDGPLERTGEAVDQATGHQADNDPADAIHDATDGNPATKP